MWLDGCHYLDSHSQEWLDFESTLDPPLWFAVVTEK